MIELDGEICLLTMTRDITERKQAEEALRESEERFRTLSAAAPIGIMLVHNKDGLVYCNERFLSIFGLPKEKAMGFGWVKYLHPDDREAFLAERSKAMAEGREFIREFRVATPQGETRWLSTHTTPLLSQEGASNTRVCTLADITERKQAEEGDRQLHAEHVRANELRRMVRILEQMAATLAHELRNPLGVISNSAYFLANQAGIDDPRVEKHAEIVGREVASAKRVIDDILEFAHVPEIIPSPARLNAIVDQALARSQVPANIRVTRKPAVDLPLLVCDEERLERGFLDVITNAVQAMPHGGRLSVKTRRSADGVAAVFADTGEGIAPQNLAKIFDPMFTTKLRGIGLGLTVVRRTVEQHGGRVEVRSVLGHGTTVTMMLPVDCRSALVVDPQSI
jgi:PAS domain S-box-containing protein